MTELPAPLTPTDLDLRSLSYMPLHVERLLISETWLIATGDEAKAAMTLWCRAWHQVPAASLPNDDRLLAALSGAGPKWKRVRDVALRGYVLCSDGRLYHSLLASEALEALEKRERWRKKKKGQRERQGGGQNGDVPGDMGGDNEGDIPEDTRGETPLRDGTGRDGTYPPSADAGARARCLALVEESLPGVRNDLRAYPALTSSQGMVEAWIREGADLERDIFPAIAAECMKLSAKGKKPIGFSWFADAVAANKARNSASLPEVSNGKFPRSESRAEVAERDRREGIAAGIADLEQRRAAGGF